MATKAKTAKGVKLYVKLDGTWHRFNEVKAVPPIGETPAKVDVTHLDSNAHEYVKDIPDYSADLTFTMNAQPYVNGGDDEDSNLNLIEMMDKNGSHLFKVEYPGHNLKVEIEGDWSWSMGAGNVSSPMEIEFTIIPRDAPAFSAMGDLKVTLSFDANGGTGTMADVENIDMGTAYSLPESTFTAPEGKIFSRWAINADGSGPKLGLNDTLEMDQSYTVYAIWTDDES